MLAASQRLPLVLLIGSLIALASPGSVLADGLSTNALVDIGPQCYEFFDMPPLVGRVVRTDDGPQYAGGETLTYEVVSVTTTPPDVGLSVTLVQPTIALPADWPSLPIGTKSSEAIMAAQIDHGLPLGEMTWTVTFVDNLGERWTATYSITLMLCPNPPPLSPSPTSSSSPSPSPAGNVAAFTLPPTNEAPTPAFPGTAPLATVVVLLATVATVLLGLSLPRQRHLRR